jgi:KaiC/GvpD/RAD55 family RecA-like ATPase
MKKKYTKKDFLDYSKAFDYTLDEITDKNKNILSDDDIKKDMKSWSLKDFQDFYGFTQRRVFNDKTK